MDVFGLVLVAGLACWAFGPLVADLAAEVWFWLTVRSDEPPVRRPRALAAPSKRALPAPVPVEFGLPAVIEGEVVSVRDR